MSDETEEGPPVALGRLTPDPCQPVLVPGGPGRHVVCGRMRARDGTHVLDTGGSSG